VECKESRRHPPPPGVEVHHRGDYGRQRCWRTFGRQTSQVGGGEGEGPSSPQPRAPVLRQHPVLRRKQLQGAGLPGTLGDVSGPLSLAPIDTASTTTQVDKSVSNGERRNKPRCTCLRQETRVFLTGFATSPLTSSRLT
jgi:hypothetical protein